VTLVPALAARPAHVTMLQRSPTYIVSRPGVDRAAMWLRKRLPTRTAYAATRWKNVLMGKAFYDFCRAFPAQARKLIAAGVKKEVGGAADAAAFQPAYAPWDQRLCLVPDGDLFAALRSGKADIVTGTIDTFTEDGVRLTSGEVLPADAIVTATGLELQFLGGMTVAVDGRDDRSGDAVELQGRDAVGRAQPRGRARLHQRVVDAQGRAGLPVHLPRAQPHGKGGYRRCTPVQDDPTMATEPLLDLQSGYVQRAQALMPRQGDRAPWRMHQSYPRDLIALRHGKVDDGVLSFAR
jgi:monooxygenase